MVRELRQRCPWDRVQTRETLRPYLVEEVFELDHALGSGDPAAIREEVSDLMLHLAWQLVLAEEMKEFTPSDAADDLVNKMRRRHPHLFELGPAESWGRLKRKEKTGGVLDGLPPALPSLVLAYRLQERAASVGFDWRDTAGPLAKVREELAEVVEVIGADGADKAEKADGADKADNTEKAEKHGGAIFASEAVSTPPSDQLVEEIGDLLFAVVNLARKARVQPTIALDRANHKFAARFQAVERLAAERGIDVPSAGLAVLDGLWEEVKQDGETDGRMVRRSAR
jgi:uncharacterized protein YabN with tetrapyrrole methylase and pyrophosphatase domain